MSRYARGTGVPVDRSKAEIERTLLRYGASHFVYAIEPGAAMIMFAVNDRNVRMRLELPDIYKFMVTAAGRTRPGGSRAAEAALDQAVRQRWRALNLVVKAKLEAVEAGIATFEDEWLAYFVLEDGATVAEKVIPQLKLGAPLLLTLRRGEKAPRA